MRKVQPEIQAADDARRAEATKGMNTPAVFFMLDINHVMRSKAVAVQFNQGRNQ
jgi:hypothetical protein